MCIRDRDIMAKYIKITNDETRLIIEGINFDATLSLNVVLKLIFSEILPLVWFLKYNNGLFSNLLNKVVV